MVDAYSAISTKSQNSVPAHSPVVAEPFAKSTTRRTIANIAKPHRASGGPVCTKRCGDHHHNAEAAEQDGREDRVSSVEPVQRRHEPEQSRHGKLALPRQLTEADDRRHEQRPADPAVDGLHAHW
jgi:hypothetical protein